MTADGRLLTADEKRHADLFWAIRGGGGNVGVITRFVYRLVEVDKSSAAGRDPGHPETIARLIVARQGRPTS